ncbi:hypothetical protein SE23_02210 [Vibrio sinaloensis]|uniref:hypothetical protein n=1 Tax=Photobacterium sp. (strain ATCC 43367) TaxID=379097 RepID=UPI00057CE708|nr:hypothetical protein [Vibrio sinaloensis]KIE22326.1 hypothetical protein SE23_02210 [Vibrio sinaloensis]
MQKNRGLATLLITSLLLVASLLVVLGSYKGLFYQVKRAQNEVQARKDHWAAEGGLECVYTKAKQLNAVPASVSDCKNLLNLDSLNIVGGTPNVIHSKSGYLTLKKAFVSPIVSSTGAIRSKSDLVINGAYTSSPDPGKSLGSNEWECMTVRYFNHFYALSYNTYHPHQAVKPYATFPDSDPPNQQKCATRNYSFGVTDLADTADDYKKDTSMDPFRDVFNVPRDEWFSVMSDKTIFGYVPYTLNDETLTKVEDLGSPTFNTQCAEEIKKNIEQGKDVIWVYGGCDINDDGFDKISTAINTHLSSGIILVVHNGILSVRGSHSFSGMLYHFVSKEFKDIDDKPLDFSGWDQTGNDVDLDGVINTLSSTGVVAMPKAKIGYFQFGAFNPSGGYVMDAPGTYAVFNAALSFSYNRDVIEGPSKKFKVVKWYRGSWHDL